MAAMRGGNFSQRTALEKIEVEANEFAATLLVPAQEFRSERKALGTACDVSHIRKLAEIFDVSQEMMATIYVSASDEKIAIVTSCHGEVRRIIPQEDFPYLGLKKGVPLPQASVTRALSNLAVTNSISGLDEVATHIWLEQRGTVTSVYEQVFLQEGGWAMTLLLVEEEEIDEEEDDRNWNRRSGRP